MILLVAPGNKYIVLTNVENKKNSNIKIKLLKNKAISTHPELILFSIRGLAVPSISMTNMIVHDFHLQYYSCINRKEKKMCHIYPTL